MKHCFSTLGCHDLSLDEIIQLASKHHMDALEIRGVQGELDNLKIKDFTPKFSEMTKQKLKQAHLEPLVLGTSCKFHDPLQRESMIHRACEEVLIAKRLGFHAIRVFGNLVTATDSGVEVGKAIQKVCEFASQHDVHIYLEVHGDFNTVERLNQVISQIETKEYFGLIWDIYHTHHVYGKNWREFYQKMKPYIQHVHLKDASGTQMVLPGLGELEIVSIVETLLKDGYEGCFSLEWERKWCPELPELDEALYALQSLFEK